MLPAFFDAPEQLLLSCISPSFFSAEYNSAVPEVNIYINFDVDMDTSVKPAGEDFNIAYSGGMGGPGLYSEIWVTNRQLKISNEGWYVKPSALSIALAASQSNFKSATGALVCPFEEIAVIVIEV